MPRNLTVAQVVQRWADRGSQSGDAVRAGVNGVQESPMEKAANAQDRWVQGCQRAAQSGKFAANLRAVSLTDWKNAMIQKGIPNMQNGYANGRRKFERFMNEFLPYARQVSAEIRAMPRGTLQQSIDRSRRTIELMAEFRNRRQAPPPRPVP